MSEEKSLIPCERCGRGCEIEDLYHFTAKDLQTSKGMICGECCDAVADECWPVKTAARSNGEG